MNADDFITPPAIKLDAVTCTFGTVAALDRVTCQIAPSAIFGLVGPNGAGKSTWLRVLLGLIRPSSGRIIIGPWDPCENPRVVRQQCSALLSPIGLYDNLTAQEHLELVGRIWRMRKIGIARRMQAVLEPWGLWPRRSERVAQWSQGMRQQLALAKALFIPTPLLLLDEPTTHLDPDARHHAIQLLIDHWTRYQPTMIVTSHDLPLIEELCHIVGILQGGHLVAVDDPHRLPHARDAATVRIHQYSEDLLELLGTIDGVTGVARQGDLAQVMVEAPGLNAVLELVVRQGAHIMNVTTASRLDETVRHMLGDEGQ